MPDNPNDMHDSLQAQSRKVTAIGLSNALEKAARTADSETVSDSQTSSQTPQVATTKKPILLKGADISNINVPIPKISPEELPHCPQCQKGLLRPGVVWFGESLPEDVIDSIDEWIRSTDKIDLMLVIGTSSKVYPAAGYTEIARRKGARVAVINMDAEDAFGLRHGDWFFEGDAGEIVPEILKSVIGEIEAFKPNSESALKK
jgi:NAD-dependent SIR2 family protein deacetylase